MLGEYLDDAYNSWLGDALTCCAPVLNHNANERRHGVEKHMTTLHDQPRLVPPPISDPPGRPSASTRASSRELLDRSLNYASHATKRGAFSVRRKFNAYYGIGSRRPQIGRPMQISHPSDFQHVGMAIPRRTGRFRPLQLSIYVDNQLSPILPHFQEFGNDDSGLTYPPQAVTTHTRSGSAMSSFTIPRKPLNSSVARLGRRSARNSVDEHESPSSTTSEWVTQPLKAPPRIPESASTQELMAALEAQLPRAPPVARLRSITEPPPLIRTGEQYGRVKSALMERQELDEQLKKLNTIIEQRQSLYLSRTSRAASFYKQPHDEPTSRPSLPNAREVSTLIQVEERPKTAPGSPHVRIPRRVTSFTNASAAFNSHPPVVRQVSHDQLRDSPLPTHHHIPNNKFPSSHPPRSDAQPPPPLPLILQSPQVGKTVGPRRSFSRSRVSNWLFPGGGEEKDRHTRTVSNESITNSPRPITSRDGFYQCIDYNAGVKERAPSPNRSLSTVMTQSTSESDRHVDAIFESEGEGDEGTRTVPTSTWSPGSSPGRASETEGMAMKEEMDLHVPKMRSFEDVENVVEDKEIATGKYWNEGLVPVRPNRTSVGVAF